jgi:hypothetical protein
MAEQATWYGQPADAVTLLQSAQTGAHSTLSTIEQAVIAADLAVAHSRTGDQADAAAATTLAYSLIDEVRPDQSPPYMYWAGRKDISFSAGEALLSGGDPTGAIPYFQAALDDLDGIDEEFPRNRVRFLTRLGVAHARTGGPDQTITLGYEAVTHAAAIDSGMTRRDIAGLCQEIEHVGHADTAALVDHARCALGPVGVSTMSS